MRARLHVRESLPWLGAGLAIVAALVAFAILAPGDGEAPSWLLATIFWVAVVPGAVLVVKGVLVILRDLRARQALLLAALAVAVLIAAVVLHNVIAALTGAEEPFFFLLALVVAPVVLVAALIRAIHPGGGSPTAPAA
jgi:hypothetical protein